MCPEPRGDRRWRRRAAVAAALALGLALVGAWWRGGPDPPSEPAFARGRARPGPARSGAGAVWQPGDAVEADDSPAAADEGRIPLRTSAAALENGVTLWVIEDHSAPIVAARVAFGVGSVDDPPGHGGLAHFVEHMVFQGTDRLGTVDWRRERPALEAEARLIAAMADRPDDRDALAPALAEASDASGRYVAPNELARLLEAIGATDVNAYTSREVTAFQATLPSNALRPWAVTMAEALRGPVFRGFARERAVVGHEIEQRTHQSGPAAALDGALFRDHPYGRPVLGTVDSLATTDVEDASAFHRQGYTPENAAVVLVGDVTLAEARALAAETFGAWSPSRAPPTVGRGRRPVPPVPALAGGVIAEPIDPITTTLAWSLPRRTAPEVVAVLAAALYSELAGSVAVVETEIQRWTGAGKLVVRCTTTGDDDCEQQATRAARTLALHGAPPGLIRAAARSAWVDQLRSLEGHAARADVLVESWARGEAPTEPWAWRTRIRSVQPEQVADAAKTWLTGYAISRRGTVVRQVGVPALAAPSSAAPDARSTFAAEVLAIPVPELDPAWRTRGVDWTEAANGAVIAARNPVNTLFEAQLSWSVGWRDDPLACAALRAWSHQLVGDSAQHRALQRGAVRVASSPSCAWDTTSLTLYGPDAYAAAALRAAWPDPQALEVDARALEVWQRYGLERGWWLRFGLPDVGADARDGDDLRVALARVARRPARLFYSGASSADAVAGWIPSPADGRSPLEPASWTQTELIGSNSGYGFVMVRPSEPFDPEREGLYALYAAWLGGSTGSVANVLRHRRGELYSASLSYARGRRVGEPNTLMIDVASCRVPQVVVELDAILGETRLSAQRWAEVRAAALENAWSAWVPFRRLAEAAGGWVAMGLDTDVRELRYAQIQDIDHAAFEAFVAAEAARPARWYVEGKAFDPRALAAIARVSSTAERSPMR